MIIALIALPACIADDTLPPVRSGVESEPPPAVQPAPVDTPGAVEQPVSIIAEPSFTGEDWEELNGAAVLPTAWGYDGPGVAFLHGDALCDGGAVRQSVAIPDDAGPLVLRAVYRGVMPHAGGMPAIQVGAQWHMLPRPSHDGLTWSEARRCLGTLGRDVDVVATTSRYVPRHPTTGACVARFDESLEFADVEIVPAREAECPEPGEVIDGDFSSAFGWATIVDGHSKAINPTIGTHGLLNSSALQFLLYDSHTGGIYSRAHVLDAPSAVEFFAVSPEGLRVSITANGHPAGSVRLASHGDTYRVCLPEWARGQVIDLGVRVGFEWGRNYSANIRPNSHQGTIAMDDMAIVADERCRPGASLEETHSGTLGTIALDAFETIAAIDVVDAPSDAQEGRSILRVARSLVVPDGGFPQYLRSGAGVSAALVVPAGDRGHGPAVTAWVRAPTDAPTTLEISDQFSVFATAQIAAGPGWQRVEVCLDPLLAGRPISVLVHTTNITPDTSGPGALILEVDAVSTTTLLEC
jgi:hypothetical protein